MAKSLISFWFIITGKAKMRLGTWSSGVTCHMISQHGRRKTLTSQKCPSTSVSMRPSGMSRQNLCLQSQLMQSILWEGYSKIASLQFSQMMLFSYLYTPLNGAYKNPTVDWLVDFVSMKPVVSRNYLNWFIFCNFTINKQKTKQRYLVYYDNNFV